MTVLDEERTRLELLDRLVTRARHLIVVNPEPLGIAEAVRIRQALGNLGTDAHLVVLNRWNASTADPDELADLPRVRVPDLGSRARTAGALDEVGQILDGAVP
jgi:hypothetical protein